MRRTSQIRITKNDREEYARLARNTKTKIKRTNQKYGVNLSGEIRLPALSEFKTRSEFNEWKRQVKSFTNRNNTEYQFVKNEHNVVATKAQINRITRNNKAAQRLADRKAKELAKQEFMVGGKKEGTVGQQMLQMGKPSVAGISRPPDFNFNKIQTNKQLREKDESMRNRSDPKFFDARTEKMKRTFERELEENFNSDAQDLLELLENVPTDDFYFLYVKNREFDYDIFYQAEGVEDDGASLKKVRGMERILRNYWKGNENFDLKGF